MSRQAKQFLAAAARKAAESDSFVPLIVLSNVDPGECSLDEYFQVVDNLDDFCEKRDVDDRADFIEKVNERLLKILSQRIHVDQVRIEKVLQKVCVYHPNSIILTLDDLKKRHFQMEKRCVIIHFDMSGSMSGSGFAPLVDRILSLSMNIESRGVPVYFSLFGGSIQEDIHRHFNNRLLTFEQFRDGKYQPQGGTAFCPSFQRTKDFPEAYDAIIVSDGDFTDNISQLPFQNQCKTVFFVAPPWSSVGVETRHSQIISSCVHPNVPYVGISSERYSQLETVIEDFLKENHSFVQLPGFTFVGSYSIPLSILAPTKFIQLFRHCQGKGEIQLDLFVKKILGIFRYLEETAKLNYARCLRGEEFKNLMSLVTPLIKTTLAHLEDSFSCQTLYGYLTKILNYFSIEQQKLVKQLENNPKEKLEVVKFWEEAMTFNEKELIIEENQKKYGSPIGCLRLPVGQLQCSIEDFSESVKQLKTLYAPEDLDLLSIIFELLMNSNIDDRFVVHPKDANILLWRNEDGNIDLMSMLRQIPFSLQQYQNALKLDQSTLWTLQPTAATRLAWVMDASNQTFPELIMKSLPKLVCSNKLLMDFDQDENRSVFWMKIVRQLAPKIQLEQTKLEMIDRILRVHHINGFLVRLNDHSITYQKQVYPNVEPFIDTDQPLAWCIFINENNDRVDPKTGKVEEKVNLITNQNLIEKYYDENLRKNGSVVRPRYLTCLRYPKSTEYSIELYDSANKKDTEILQEQISKLDESYSDNQIKAHIHTIRDRLQSIPSVLWNDKTIIEQTVRTAKEKCQGAILPVEQVTINIPKSVIADYIAQSIGDPFIIGVFRGFNEYSRLSSQPGSISVPKIDYLIECSEKGLAVPCSDTTTTTTTTKFNHFDKPGVKEYLQEKQEKFVKSLKNVDKPPQIQSLSVLVQRAKESMINSEVLGFADLECLPGRTTTTTIDRPPKLGNQLNRELFTCPITLEIMEDPVGTSPCGHMFERQAIEQYMNTVGNLCPLCRKQISEIVQNFAFKSVIQAWSSQQND